MRTPMMPLPDSDTDVPQMRAPVAHQRLRFLGPFCTATGLIIGLSMAATDMVNQEAVSIAAALFFACCNFVPDTADDRITLGLTCSALASFFGYGIGTACNISSLLDAIGLEGRSSWGRIEWQGSSVNVLRVPLFLVLVMMFHATEFTFQLAFHPKDVSFRAFLLTPVPAGGYSIAMIAALAEFWLEFWLFRDVRMLPTTLSSVIFWVGFVVSLSGWIMRSSALFTAQSNFTHLVMPAKRASHELVQEGVYRLCRHPGYLGWFMWSVSTQIVLGNPVCMLLYALVAWRFFAGRIPVEEQLLVRFFGDEYLQCSPAEACLQS